MDSCQICESCNTTVGYPGAVLFQLRVHPVLCLTRHGRALIFLVKVKTFLNFFILLFMMSMTMIMLLYTPIRCSAMGLLTLSLTETYTEIRKVNGMAFSDLYLLRWRK